jgi:hypothetical protein
MPLVDAPALPARNFGYAWLFLCLALCLHVADEALTGFLPMYNATVRVMRAQHSWFPMPTFEFREWLTGLIVGCVLLLLVTPFAFKNAGWLRPIAYIFAVIMFFNGMGHTLATIFGRTVSSVAFPRPAPGFYSSPFLFVGSVWLLMRLRSSRKST